MKNKINPETDLIPIETAAHYTIGGIKTDGLGATSIRGILRSLRMPIFIRMVLTRCAGTIMSFIILSTREARSKKWGFRGMAVANQAVAVFAAVAMTLSITSNNSTGLIGLET